MSICSVIPIPFQQQVNVQPSYVESPVIPVPLSQPSVALAEHASVSIVEPTELTQVPLEVQDEVQTTSGKFLKAHLYASVTKSKCNKGHTKGIEYSCPILLPLNLLKESFN